VLSDGTDGPVVEKIIRKTAPVETTEAPVEAADATKEVTE
jgi:hypothetical protein